MEQKYIESVKFHGEVSGYLSDIPAVEWLTENGELELRSAVTFFVGENGTGKSTLLEAIAVAAGFNAEGGSRNFSFSTRETHSALHDNLTISRGLIRPRDGFFLRAESLYNAASYIDELDEIPCAAPRVSEGFGGSLHTRSHGESFIATVSERFRGNGLYLLDEPEAALSPVRQLTLLGLIKDLTANNSQFIIATHSPILMAYPNAEILRFSEDGINPVGYKQTEHYQITKQFLDNPERMLGIIFEENSGNG